MPFHPKHWLKVTTAGLKPNDFVMVMGYPGRTNRNETASELHHELEWYYPYIIACRARLVRRWGTPVTTPGGEVWAFPTPARLAAARLREYRALKFSTRKGEYIRDVARATVRGALDLDALMAAPSVDVIATLTALRGLGRWTADWFLARCCGRGDVCPAGDLAVRKAFEHHWARRGRTLSEEAIRRRSRTWGEHQNVAVHYLLAGMRLHAAARGGEA